jgi:hypothetical protein
LDSLDRKFIAAATLLWVGWVVVHGQNARLRLEHLDKLAAKAEETVDVTLDEFMPQLASGFLSDQRSHEEGQAKELVGGLKGVYVRSYKFDEAGAYLPKRLPNSVSAVTKNVRAAVILLSPPAHQGGQVWRNRAFCPRLFLCGA